MPRGAPRMRAEDGKKNRIGSRVRARRLQMGLTRDQLSGRLALVTDGNWNPATQEILHIEQGVRLVTDIEVVTLAQALGVDACWLLLG